MERLMLTAAGIVMTGAWLICDEAVAQQHVGLSPALMFGCNQASVVNVASGSTQQLVATNATMSVYVCGFDLQTSSAGTVTIENSPVSSCTASVSASFALQLGAGEPLVDHQFVYTGMMAAPLGNALCIVNSASATVNGFVFYTQF